MNPDDGKESLNEVLDSIRRILQDEEFPDQETEEEITDRIIARNKDKFIQVAKQLWPEEFL